MAYHLELFSPDAYALFLQSPRDLTGFRARCEKAAAIIQPGDLLVAYLTRLSRWAGLLEVVDGPYRDEAPLFFSPRDPFVIRFKVKPLVCLPIDLAIPIHEKTIWQSLSFTRGREENTRLRPGVIRDLAPLSAADGDFLAGACRARAAESRAAAQTPSAAGRVEQVAIFPPSQRYGAEADDPTPDRSAVRESRRIQALLARIGAAMGMKIWLPKADRSGVMQEWQDESRALLDVLPLSYDEATLRTIEQIDVLWLKGHSIVRAFEVEHTTSVYSGILRMADLLALQPNMDIKLHIVAPDDRRHKVFQELTRPVFSLFARGPLAEMCTFISYSSLHRLAEEKHLAYLADSVLEEYAEEAG